MYPANPLFCRFYEFINMHIFLSPSPFMVLFLFLRFLLVYVFVCSVVLQPTPPTRLLFLNNNIKRNFHEYNNSRHAVYFKKKWLIYISLDIRKDFTCGVVFHDWPGRHPHLNWTRESLRRWSSFGAGVGSVWSGCCRYRCCSRCCRSSYWSCV